MSIFIAFAVAYYLNVSFSRSITSVGVERSDFVCYRLLLILFPVRRSLLFLWVLWKD